MIFRKAILFSILGINLVSASPEVMKAIESSNFAEFKQAFEVDMNQSDLVLYSDFVKKYYISAVDWVEKRYAQIHNKIKYSNDVYERTQVSNKLSNRLKDIGGVAAVGGIVGWIGFFTGVFYTEMGSHAYDICIKSMATSLAMIPLGGIIALVGDGMHKDEWKLSRELLYEKYDGAYAIYAYLKNLLMRDRITIDIDVHFLISR